jgi:putative ABC transport system permease protein
MDNLLRDLRYGMRCLAKRRGITTIAILTLALGIGANSAIFSVVNAIVLRPLPYPESEKLVVLWGNIHAPGLDQLELSAPELTDFQTQLQSLEHVSGYTIQGFNLTGDSQPERLRGAAVSASLFRALKVDAALGRTFLAEEDRYGNDRVVLLSDSLWRRRYGADPSIVNRTIMLDGQALQVIGVMPSAFQFPDREVEAWRTLAFEPDLLTENNRGSHFLNAIARLRSGVTEQQAQAELNNLTARLSADHKQSYSRGFSASIRSLHADTVGGGLRTALFILLGAVGLVLAVACANVAHLMLGTASARYREIAVRTALGASRGTVIRQFLTESLLLSVIGGLAGLTLAIWGVRALVSLLPKDTPRIDEIGLDYRVAGFTFLVSILTGVLFGLAPAFFAAKTDLHDALKEGGRGQGEAGKRLKLRNALVVSEFALAMVLLIAAGLLVQSFRNLQEVRPGFEPENLMTMRFSLPSTKYDNFQKSQAFYDQLFQRLQSRGEVKSVGAINILPFSGSTGDRSFSIEDQPVAANQPRPDEQVRFVSHGYFGTMSIPLMRGRDFSSRDTGETTRVAVVNAALAEKFWPNGEAIGKRISFSRDNPKWYEIVGVVGNIKHRGLDLEYKPELYISYQQPLFTPPGIPSMYVVIRSTGDPNAVIGVARNEVAAIDRDQPIGSVMSMDQRIHESVAPRRFNMFLLTLFAVLAVLLASVGIYGIMAFSVTQRTREFGVRLALGAQRSDVMSMVLRHGIKLALLGVGVGLLAAFALTRLMSSLLFEVSPTDLRVFLIDAVVLLVVSLLACYLPARRATNVDPLVALRNE